MIFEYYIIICCFLVWIGISIWAIHYVYTKSPALFFTPVEASITDTKVTETAQIASSDGPDTRTMQELIVSYSFNLDGKVYLGNENVGGDFKKIEGERPLYKGKLNAGDTITVYYNPENPSENCLHRFYFIGGLVCLGFGQLFLWIALDLIERWVK